MPAMDGLQPAVCVCVCGNAAVQPHPPSLLMQMNLYSRCIWCLEYHCTLELVLIAAVDASLLLVSSPYNGFGGRLGISEHKHVTYGNI